MACHALSLISYQWAVSLRGGCPITSAGFLQFKDHYCSLFPENAANLLGFVSVLVELLSNVILKFNCINFMAIIGAFIYYIRKDKGKIFKSKYFF